MNRNPFILVAFNAALAFFCITRASAQAWLPGTNGSIYNPNNIGNVGINTSSPWSALDIRTNGSASTGYYGVNIQNPATIPWSTINLNLATGNSSSLIQSQLDNTGPGTNLFFHTADGNGSTQPRMSIMSTGRVGIGLGNTNPSVALSVLTNFTADALEVKYNSAGFVRLHANSLSSGNWNQITMLGDGGLIYGGTSPSTGFGFVIAPWSLSMSGIHMDQNGNVGIYTNDTKNYQLAVNGNAIFNKIVVKPYPWSDYVFDSTYTLRPLDKVAQYIRDNHHLPEIPSADSVANAGIDVGANQAALLKKIEELTLYVIGQQQQLDRLTKKDRHREQEHQLLKAKYQQLQKQITDLKQTTR